MLNRLKNFLFVGLRIQKYRLLSTCARTSGRPECVFPLLMRGAGSIEFGSGVQNGIINAHHYYSGYNYILAMEPGSQVTIGDGVVLGNGCSLQAVSRISIGEKSMIGVNCFLVDTDGHDLHPERRMDGQAQSAPITIGRNVWIFYNSVVLKGVTIGDNSVIGAGSVVTGDIPANVFAAGNPARVIKSLA